MLDELPPEDFMYDRVDNNFLTDVNLLLHFLRMSHGRVQKNQSNHLVCEVFLILKELIKNHLPSMNEKIVPTKEAEDSIVGIIKSGRIAVAKAVDEELKKTLDKAKK